MRGRRLRLATSPRSVSRLLGYSRCLTALRVSTDCYWSNYLLLGGTMLQAGTSRVRVPWSAGKLSSGLTSSGLSSSAQLHRVHCLRPVSASGPFNGISPRCCWVYTNREQQSASRWYQRLLMLMNNQDTLLHQLLHLSVLHLSNISVFSCREAMLHTSWERGNSKTFNRNEVVFLLFCSSSRSLDGVCSLIQFYSFARKEPLRWGTWPISAALYTQCNSLAWVHYMACVTSRQVVLLLFLSFMDVPDGGIRFC
jgi:hypothetical protein